MDLQTLIQEGEQLRSEIRRTQFGSSITGESYEKWVAKGMYFMESNYPSSSLTERFMEAAKTSGQRSVEKFEKMLGILKALQEME